MINKIYGNKFALQTFDAMFKSGRIPHSFLIYGEKGLGKKMLANFLAAAILCEKHTGIPCDECHSCKIAMKNIHPDIIYPEQSGKLNTYTVEVCRHICADAFIAPNNGNYKVYIFADADNIQLPAQNSLLKIIEEPPEFVYFIFTASFRDVFLPTILSRVTSIGASICSNDECAAALTMKGYEQEQIKNAIEVFGGNIGMCVKYLENEELQTITALTKRAADSIINRDEYSLLSVFSAAELKDRQLSVTFLEMLDRVIRDSVLLKYNDASSITGCYSKGAVKLSEKISVKTSEKIHRYLNQAAADIKSNVNFVLLMSALCGEIMNS